MPATPVDERPAAATLRERKKAATREAIGLAALRLALERGLEKVRVGDIAAAAGVSPRTYNNYFSSREEAICAYGAERARRVVGALRERPPGEPLAEALLHAFSDHHLAGDPDKVALRLLSCDPALLGEFLKVSVVILRPLADAIAERAGLDAEDDLAPFVLAAAYEGAVRAATLRWLRPGCTCPLAELVQEALALLAPVASTLEPAERQGREPCRGRAGR